MMKKYVIGRVQKPWENRAPPIQGGSPKCKVQDINDNTEKSSVSKRVNGSSFGSAKIESPSSSYIASQTKEQIDVDLTKYPSLDSGVQNEIAKKYRALEDRLRREGLYNCDYSAYLSDALRCSILFSVMLLFLHLGQYVLSAISLGCFWHQLVFTVHDAAHMGITHNYHIDSVIGMSIGSFIGGLSVCWWKHSHNIHHIVTNAPEHDPDIEHLPFLAVSHRFFNSLRSTYYDRVMEYTPVAKLMMQYQSYFYYLILAFGRFNLYVLSWEYLFLDRGPRSNRWHRYFEIVGIAFFWYWFGYRLIYLSIPGWNRLAFVMISHMVTMPLHVQFTLSHFAMSTADLGPSESFAQKMLRTTMDVDCPLWMDFFHGGLQFQAVHHLFPRLPRYNLRKASTLVREFSMVTGVGYEVFGFGECNGKVLSRLEEVGRQAAVMKMCQESVVKRGLGGQ